MALQNRPLQASYENIDACRQLAPLIFDDLEVGTQNDIIYAPLKQFSPTKTHHFLRMFAGRRYGVGEASLELVEYFPDDTERVMNGYVVDTAGIRDVTEDTVPYLGHLELDWPYVAEAPQIQQCLDAFQSRSDAYVPDSKQLFGELMAVQEVADSTPHISIKEAKGYGIEEFNIDFFYRQHAMPKKLSDIIKVGPPASEQIGLIAQYQGRVILNATLLFDSRHNLLAYTGTSEEDAPEAVIDTLAAFKRNIFN